MKPGWHQGGPHMWLTFSIVNRGSISHSSFSFIQASSPIHQGLQAQEQQGKASLAPRGEQLSGCHCQGLTFSGPEAARLVGGHPLSVSSPGRPCDKGGGQ